MARARTEADSSAALRNDKLKNEAQRQEQEQKQIPLLRRGMTN
jgi:hypothetical protein